MFDTIKTAFEGLWNSFIRTLIPVIVSAAVNLLIRWGLPVDGVFADALTNLLSVGAGALFYIIVRVVEKQLPKAGILLGSTKQPVYVAPAAVPAVEKIAAVAEKVEETT